MQSTNALIELPSPETLMVPAQGWLTEASEFQVDTPEASAIAQARRAAVNAEMKRLEQERLAITRPLDESKARTMALFAPPLAVLKHALDQYGTKVIAYNRAQDEMRIIAQRKADELVAREKKRLQDQADKAAAKGNETKAETLQAAAASIVAPIIRTDAPKVAGTQFRKVWKFRLRDASKINAAFMAPDEVKIGKQVRATGKDAEGIVGEGIEVWAEDVIASGRV
jgi:hypothetical protein